MDLVREAINYIRANWDEYPTFMLSLRDLMQDNLNSCTEASFHRRVEALFSSVKQWSDRWQNPTSDDYSAIRLYTSADGYIQMFRTINTAFRQDEFTNQAAALRSAVFLVELLNIDLFNYCRAYSHDAGFEGRIYRGMCVSSDELKAFSMIASRPIEERYLAIPLAMMSTSTDRENALSFALKEASKGFDRHPILWEIHVAGLDPKLLEVYHERFPTSVVSSICAVPIEQLSDYPDENEVLLRGPFFQILRFQKENIQRDGTPLHVIEAIMLNANRDHISIISLNDSDAHRARKLFQTLVAIERATLCAERVEEYGLQADAKTYRSILSAERARLDDFLFSQLSRHE
jgi:hypothetical protein